MERHNTNATRAPNNRHYKLVTVVYILFLYICMLTSTIRNQTHQQATTTAQLQRCIHANIIAHIFRGWH